jgi:hypothetical protein
MGVGGGLEGELVHGDDGGVGRGVEVFLRAATNRARSPGRVGP